MFYYLVVWLNNKIVGTKSFRITVSITDIYVYNGDIRKRTRVTDVAQRITLNGLSKAHCLHCSAEAMADGTKEFWNVLEWRLPAGGHSVGRHPQGGLMSW